MRTIGIRAAPKAVTFVVFDADADAVLNVEDIRIPIAFHTPEALKYVRNNLLDILREYGIERAGIRVTEPSAQSPNIARIQIEGVVQEAFASSLLKSYYVGQISSISARLGIERADFKRYVDGQLDWPVENWASLRKEQREALLCAMGASRA
ncbi:hypothetical protein PPN31119_03275 [Pandoraea pnomenusa]|uniref:DUF3010 family protein n=1 Tax=Pandoraea pnomenusa TaxID=93220 RepID=A0ABY6WMC6_9BURK|nr:MULTISPECIES: hypothetical protein [Burkholderiaceae]AOI66968.1 hypothetical protein WS51_26095 [Burkholderia territorii]KUZ33118.1 hypothetical protein WS52_18975 [Burkholderia territorii]KUZ57993.1 hypothetical protein WS53_11025 [Burkholderia territorii]MBS6362639.1 hypothetical protein [Burkholderia sp.]VVE69378.1 hypothetical protein PPN31119_03275 [Pandoraea pnomenusa]